MRIYIDDERTPKTNFDKVLRTSQEAIDFIKTNGCPEYISFDHDLGGEDTSIPVVDFIIDSDLNLKGEFIPKNFEFNVHSANPVGAKNIAGKLSRYLDFRKSP